MKKFLSLFFSTDNTPIGLISLGIKRKCFPRSDFAPVKSREKSSYNFDFDIFEYLKQTSSY